MANEFYDEKKHGSISPDKLAFANEGVRLTDIKFDDKPIGYFKDAWIRFRKNKVLAETKPSSNAFQLRCH